MARWEPDAVGRLRQAAMELFHERGYAVVTVAEIADRAGLTKRTFFNHFTDKREVMFAYAHEFQANVLAHLSTVDAAAEPIDAALTALTRAGVELSKYGTREFAQVVRRLIMSSAELQERELIKMAGLTSAIADQLQERNVPERTAVLAGQAAIIVFNVAYADWITGPDDDLDALIGRSLDDFRRAVGPH